MALSDEQNAMLRLLAQGEQGYGDIAALMGLGEDEVRAKVVGALAQLRGRRQARARRPAADRRAAPSPPRKSRRRSPSRSPRSRRPTRTTRCATRSPPSPTRRAAGAGRAAKPDRAETGEQAGSRETGTETCRARRNRHCASAPALAPPAAHRLAAARSRFPAAASAWLLGGGIIAAIAVIVVVILLVSGGGGGGSSSTTARNSPTDEPDRRKAAPAPKTERSRGRRRDEGTDRRPN